MPIARKVLIACAIGLAALLFADGDPAGIVSGRFRATSERLTSLGSSADARPAALFAFGDFSSLSSETLRTSAAPWLVTSTLLALGETGGDVEAVSEEALARALRRFGFLWPEWIENWPGGALPMPAGAPLGMNVGTGGRAVPPVAVTVSNLGCAACHAGIVYEADGTPDPRAAWLGTPNTSINLEAYVVALYEAMRDYAQDDARLLPAMRRLHPQMGLREEWTLRLLVLPEMRKRLAAAEAGSGRILPFPSSLAGATNGLDSLRNRLGLIGAETHVPEGGSAFNSIPDLGGRTLRDSLLNNGAYRRPGSTPGAPRERGDVSDDDLRAMAWIVAYFMVPSMGITPEVAESEIGDVHEVLRWMHDDYRSQPFPGAVDGERADRGRDVYAARCASCHGVYSDEGRPRLVSFPNVSSDIGTDQLRLDLFDDEVAGAINNSPYAEHLEAAPTRAYAAPPLDGLWSSAPYLHNGSVPTLWHFMRPSERPARFTVGGHRLDMARVGIAGSADREGGWTPPAGYQPFSDPVPFDTALPGLSNGGHESPFDAMGEREKDDLLEYLKRL